MTSSFNLTSEAWIPCELADGTMKGLSTAEALGLAHQVRAIADSSPLVVGALHRHLLAVLHRAHDGPRSLGDWSRLARLGRFEGELVGAYLERAADRMDLFHPEHPFGQARGLVEQFNVTPIDELGVERSGWGSGRELFQHRDPMVAATMTPAEAARALLAHHAFATGGLIKKPGEPTSATGAPLTKAALVLLRGRNLFETLMANLLVYDPARAVPVPCDAGDAPAWEQAAPPRSLPVGKEPKKMPLGWLDLLTWLSRRIELVEQDGLVTGFVRAVGKGLDDAFERDPMVTYGLDEKRGFVPIAMNPKRAFWRNANALFESNRPERQFLRPMAIDLVSAPEVQDVLGQDVAFQVEVFGIAAYQSRVDDIGRERVYAHARLFDDPEAFEAVNEVLRLAEDMVGALRYALRAGYARYMLSAGDRQPDKKDMSALADSLGAEPRAYAQLGQLFDEFLLTLARDPALAVEDFRSGADRCVRDCFQVATSGAEGTGGALKAQAMGTRLLNMSLAKLKKTNEGAELTPEARA